MNKDVAEVVRHLRRQKLLVVPTKSGHLDVVDGDERVYVLASTPSDRRWKTNTVSELKRLGLWHRPKARKKHHGGQPPPPLPVIPRKEVTVAGKTATLTASLKDRAVELEYGVRLVYDLKVRGGRATGHGYVPVMAQVMQAYEAATGKMIPSFKYTDRDTSDRLEMARLAGGRISDMCHLKVGTSISVTGRDTLDYAEEAWRWHEDHHYDFPDGRRIKMVGTSLQVDYPLLKPQADVEDDLPAWLAAPLDEPLRDDSDVEDASVEDLAEVLADSITDKFITEAEQAIKEYRAATNGASASPLAFRVLAKLAAHGVPEDEAILLAMEIDQR